MNLKAFLAVLEYLYTDEVSKNYQGSKVAAMAVANFFCLPRLVALYERLIVEEMETDMFNVKNVVGECPSLLISFCGSERLLNRSGSATHKTTANTKQQFCVKADFHSGK